MSKAFASYPITLFTPVTFLWCAHSNFPFNISSQFNHRYCQHNVSTTSPCALPAVIDTRICHILSHSDVACIRVFWEDEAGSRGSFDRLPHSCRRYDLGDEQGIITSVPKTLLVKVYA